MTRSMFVFIMTLTVPNAQWVVNPIPLFRNDMYMAVGASNNSIYLLGGNNNRQQLITYDITTDTLVDMGSAVLREDVYTRSQGYTQIDNILYIVSGINMRLTIFDMIKYNIRAIPLPIDLIHGPCLSSTNTHLFVIGGGDNNGILNDVQMLEISTQSWNDDIPSMIRPRAWFSCIVEPNTQDLYAIGGGDYYTNWKSIERIQTNDIEHNIWAYISGEFNRSALFTRSIAYNGYIFVIGGANIDAGSQYFVDVHVIDPSNGSVSVLQDRLVYGVYSTAAIVVDAVIYAFGGGNGMIYTDTVNTWMRYDLSMFHGPTASSITSYPTINPSVKSPANSSTNDPTVLVDPTVVPTIESTIQPPNTQNDNVNMVYIILGVLVTITFICIRTINIPNKNDIYRKTKNNHWNNCNGVHENNNIDSDGIELPPEGNVPIVNVKRSSISNDSSTSINGLYETMNEAETTMISN